ncbi:MAG TPA: hypothetical protein VNF06_03805 [Candidatus Aquilonibacter sp.]|nr:hypothetical protein [Candidatus Aquilonibacter sp.]
MKQIKQNRIELLLLVIIIALILSALARQSFLLYGQVLYASVISYILAFLVAIHFLNKKKVGRERYFIGLYAVVSGVWLYELVYHYLFPGQSVISDFLSFTINISSTFPLIWGILMMALPLIAYKYMRINLYFLAAIAVSMLFFLIWYLIGFPQFISPEWYPINPPYIVLIPLQYAHTSNYLITFWGSLLNSLSKLLDIVPALLFVDRNGRKQS